VKLGLCNEVLEGYSVEATAEVMKKLGYEGVEIAPYTLARSPRDIDKAERARIRHAFTNRGIEIIGIHWIYQSPPGLHIFKRETRDLTFQHTIDCIKLNRDLGGHVIVVGSPFQRTIPEGMSPKEAWRMAIEFFSKAGDYAYRSGAVIALKPLPRKSMNFINKVDEALKLVMEVDSAGLELMVDTTHADLEEPSITEALRRAGKNLVHVHASDREKYPVGTRGIDFPSVLAALKEIGYGGYVSVETKAWPDPYIAAKISSEHLKPILTSLKQ